MVDPYLSLFYSCISDCISRLPGIPPGIIGDLWCNVNGMLIVCFWKTCIVKHVLFYLQKSLTRTCFLSTSFPKASLPALSALVPDFQSFGGSLCIYSSPTSVNENKRTPCVKCFTFITLHNWRSVYLRNSENNNQASYLLFVPGATVKSPCPSHSLKFAYLHSFQKMKLGQIVCAFDSPLLSWQS